MPYYMKKLTSYGNSLYVHRTGSGGYQTYPSRSGAVKFRTLETAQKAARRFGYRPIQVRFVKVK